MQRKCCLGEAVTRLCVCECACVHAYVPMCACVSVCVFVCVVAGKPWVWPVPSRTCPDLLRLWGCSARLRPGDSSKKYVNFLIS